MGRGDNPCKILKTEPGKSEYSVRAVLSLLRNVPSSLSMVVMLEKITPLVLMET